MPPPPPPPRKRPLARAEARVAAAKLALLLTAEKARAACRHTTVYACEPRIGQLMRICPACGLEEWGTYWSSSLSGYWQRRDYKPGALDNAAGRAVTRVDAQTYYAARVEGQPFGAWHERFDKVAAS